MENVTKVDINTVLSVKIIQSKRDEKEYYVTIALGVTKSNFGGSVGTTNPYTINYGSFDKERAKEVAETWKPCIGKKTSDKDADGKSVFPNSVLEELRDNIVALELNLNGIFNVDEGKTLAWKSSDDEIHECSILHIAGTANLEQQYNAAISSIRRELAKDDGRWLVRKIKN